MPNEVDFLGPEDPILIQSKYMSGRGCKIACDYFPFMV
jgi:hypothetical protein